MQPQVVQFDEKKISIHPELGGEDKTFHPPCF